MTLVRTALIAPYRRLQAKADKSHGQDANRALESILERRFWRELGKGLLRASRQEHGRRGSAGSPAQVASQVAQAEEDQGAVPAEPAQPAKDSEQGHMSQADMQPVADATMAPVHAQEVQELTCMAGRDRQDAGQDTFHAGPVPGTQNTAQDSEQGQASQQEEAAGTENTVQEEEDRPGPSVEELRARARELKAQGLNQCQIAREIGKSETSVRRYLKAEA